MQTMKQQDLKYWLALYHTPDVGPVTFHKIWQQVPRLADLFATNSGLNQQLHLPPLLMQRLLQPNWELVERDLLWCDQPSHHIVTYADPLYPARLKQIPAAPPLLYVVGDPQLLATTQLAIVGSRNPTPTGYETAFTFAKALSKVGLTITSGLALGIDAACHQGAIKQHGKTIAVMGTGLQYIYPRQHQKLTSEIIATGGAVVSELPLNCQPHAENFPRRNRIISGLSLGVLVVEAAVKSGSLITARYALEQGREVFAIPGSIHNPLSRGCHQLLRQGAKLVEVVEDIIEELAPQLPAEYREAIMLRPPAPSQVASSATHSEEILNYFGFETTTIDALLSRSGLDIPELNQLLATLELAGEIQAVPGGYVRASVIA
jgi:DNA processing protein